MQNLQKYFLHPVTALLFAGSTAQFIHHFHLLDFPYAALLGFLVVLTSYLMLSKKYDPSLSAIFFAIALFISYKAIHLKPLPDTHLPPEQAAKKNLTILATLAKKYEIQNNHLPDSVREIKANLLADPEPGLALCLPPDCKISLPPASSRFWIYTPVSLAHDKTTEIWYIDDQFDMFRKKTDGSFETVLP